MKDANLLIEKAFVKSGSNLRKFAKETIRTKPTPTAIAYTLRELFAVSASARNQAAKMVADIVFAEARETEEKLERARIINENRVKWAKQEKENAPAEAMLEKLTGMLHRLPTSTLRLLTASEHSIGFGSLHAKHPLGAFMREQGFSDEELKIGRRCVSSLVEQVSKITDSRIRSDEFALQMKYFNEAQAKGAAFDKILEMLDLQKVGNKLLGDCTKADLLRAATALDDTSHNMTIQATFYRALAAMVPSGQTVRTANERGKIVALLTHQFKEPD